MGSRCARCASSQEQTIDSDHSSEDVDSQGVHAIEVAQGISSCSAYLKLLRAPGRHDLLRGSHRVTKVAEGPEGAKGATIQRETGPEKRH